MAGTIEKRPGVRKVFLDLVDYPTATTFAPICESVRQEEDRLAELDRQNARLENKLGKRRVTLVWANLAAARLELV